MAENSNIEWTTHTLNPWRGCTKVSPGCAHCYAETLSGRNPKTLGMWGPKGTRVIAAEAQWKLPLKWNREAWCGNEFCLKHKAEWKNGRCSCGLVVERPRVFCASLADVFEDWTGNMLDAQGQRLWVSRCVGANEIPAYIPERPQCDFSQCRPLTMQDVRRRLFSLIDATPNLDWLVLTKRPENVAKMMPGIQPLRNEPDEEEEWRPIPGHEPYLASSHGRIKGPRGIVTGDQNDTGHRRVTLHGVKGRHREQSYRLVLLAFVGEPPTPDCQARHLDGDTSNNCRKNLAWGDQSKNWDDSKAHGSHQRYTKLTIDQVRDIRRRYADGFTFTEIANHFPISDTQVRNICTGKHWREPTVRSNLWLGTSVENQQAADERIPHLLRVPAAIRFLSVEPMLGPVDLSWWLGSMCRDCRGRTTDDDCRLCNGLGWIGLPEGGCADRPNLHWVIVGGESGPGARPCNVEWIRSIVEQCRAAGVPVFVKQLGSNPVWTYYSGKPTVADDQPYCSSSHTRRDGIQTLTRLGKDKKGGDPEEWPTDLRVRDFPSPERPME